jgi:methyl-accepting chemotaxis protein
MNLSIGQKIVLGFGLVFLITCGFGAYDLQKLGEIKALSEEISSDDVGIRRLQDRLADSHHGMQRLLERSLVVYLLSKSSLTDETAAAVQREWLAAKQTTEGLIRETNAYAAKQHADAVTEARKVQWSRLLAISDQAASTLKTITPEVETVFALVNSDKPALLAKQLPKLDAARKELDGLIASGETIRRALVEAGRSSIANSYENAQLFSGIALVALLVVGIAIASVMYRSITGPLGVFMRFVERIGQGDLTEKTGLARGDELGQLAQNLDKMVDGLRQFASQSRAGAENLNSAAAETLASTKQQAASVEEQFAAVQETTATLEEITQSGAQISDRAKNLTATAEAASSTGKTGLEAAVETARAMDAIRDQAEAVAENIVLLSEKTQTIGEIIATVNDIAERAHLLALNAAIEAAGASENGGGFTVVANELKNLADQAKESTAAVRTNLSDIQQGINTSVMLTEEAVKRIGVGKVKTDSTQEAMRQLTENIQQSVQAFQQIVAATNQQQIGLEQVTQALQSIRQASEQTAAGTTQVEQAAANLSALGEQLLRSAGSYRL